MNQKTREFLKKLAARKGIRLANKRSCQYGGLQVVAEVQRLGGHTIYRSSVCGGCQAGARMLNNLEPKNVSSPAEVAFVRNGNQVLSQPPKPCGCAVVEKEWLVYEAPGPEPVVGALVQPFVLGRRLRRDNPPPRLRRARRPLRRRNEEP